MCRYQIIRSGTNVRAGGQVTTYTNDLGQVVGFPIPDWTPPEGPAREVLVGRVCRAEPLRIEDHAEALYQAFTVEGADAGWSYLPYGPFDTRDAFDDWIRATCLSDNPLFFAFVDVATGKAVGLASYLNINRAYGTIEVGHVHFAPVMQRSPDRERGHVSDDAPRVRRGIPPL